MMKKATITQLSTQAVLKGYIWGEPQVGSPFVFYKSSKGVDKYKKVLTTTLVTDIIKTDYGMVITSQEDKYQLNLFRGCEIKGVTNDTDYDSDIINDFINSFGSC